MRTWVSFWLLAVIWGSSYLLMKIAYRQLDAITIGGTRLVIAAVLFAGFMLLTRRKWPRKAGTWVALIAVGVLNTALPFVLIAWGTGEIDSGLATILTATTPFFSLTIAHFAIADERLDARKSLGLAIGFAGVVVLGTRGLSGDTNPIAGQFAVLAGSLCYGISLNIIRRKLRGVEPIVIASVSIIIGAIAILPVNAAVLGGLPPIENLADDVWVSVIALGVVNTWMAYFLFYHLVDKWGPRASLVTYAMPPIGVGLGVMVLGEALDWRLLAGAALIFAGIFTIQSRARTRQLSSTATAAPFTPPIPAESAAIPLAIPAVVETEPHPTPEETL